MKTTNFTILTCLFTTVTFGQIEFDQIGLPSSNHTNIGDFHQVLEGATAFIDIDNDNDLDIIITGNDYAANWNIKARIYINNGNGSYTPKQGITIEGVEHGAIAVADIDNDNDNDLLISGREDGGQISSKLYTNDGFGNFSLVNGTPFIGLENCDIAFADIDNDNDQDVLITGFEGTNHRSDLYTNNGNGTFNLVSGTTFTGGNNSSISFTDIDNDNDKDLLISGYYSSGTLTPINLYTNDGFGNFSLVASTPFGQVSGSSFAFADIDNDNDQDLLITGIYSSQHISKLYLNNGSGIFSLISGTTIAGVSSGSVAFADIDNDNDQDVLITGEDGSGSLQPLSKIYLNDGIGNFSAASNSPLVGIKQGSASFGDIDNDSDQDILIIGANDNNDPFIKIYNNDGSGNMTLVIGTPFHGGAYNGKISFADIDNDQDQDVLIAGRTSPYFTSSISDLYINDGIGNFSLDTNTPFIGLIGFNSFVDIDNDDDDDVLSCGYDANGQATSNLFLNDGNGNFNLSAVNLFDNLSIGSVALTDVDNDNDKDVLIFGDNALSRLFLNDGSGSFTLSPMTLPFPNLENSTVTFEDVDNDNDQDVLITGDKGTSGAWNNNAADLYLNDGSGNYTLKPRTPFIGVRGASVVFADTDNDNDKDVLIVGYNGNAGLSRLYLNDGTGNFSLLTGVGVPFSFNSEEVLNSSVEITDIDNDGDQDIIISGTYENSIYPQYLAVKIYLNNGNNNFSFAYVPRLEGLQRGDIAFTDIDNDNDQDLLTNGVSWSSSPGVPIANLYRNTLLKHCPFSSKFTVIDNGNGNYSFTNTSAGSYNQSYWAFGDGTIDSTTNTNHTFTTNGNFTVVLAINDSTIQGDSCTSYYLETIVVSGITNPLQCNSGFVIYPDNNTGDITVINNATGYNLTYLWDFGDGNTSTLQNPSHTYATAGPFYLCLTVDDSNGCNDMYCDSIGKYGVVFNKAGGFNINIISPNTTGADNNIDLNSDINIYPNPTSNQLSIDTEQSISKVTIVDITGKTVMIARENTNVINVTDLSDGIYFIQLITENRTITKKLVKQ